MAKMFAKTFTSLILIFTVFLQLHATEFNVSNSTQISDVMNLAQPGDTVTLANGIWKDQRIDFGANGSSDSPILIRAKDQGQVQFQGKSYIRIGGDYLIVSGFLFINGYSPSGAPIEFRTSSGKAHHSRLTNSAIVNYNPSNKDTDYKWVSLYGQYNRVDNCYFYGKKHSGTTLVVWLANDDIEEYHTIDHNYFGYRPELGYNGGETIRIGTSSYSMDNSRCIVEYNYFERCNGETEIISNKSCENIYRYNTFVECEGILTLRHGNRCTVEGNYFFGNGNTNAGGVRVIGEDHKVFNNYFENLRGTGFYAAIPIMNGVPNSPLNRYFQVKNARVVNNTFVNCRQNITIGFHADNELTLPPLNCTIANNVVSTNSDMPLITVEAEPINMTYSANVMFGSTLGISPDSGITQIDPKISQAEDGLYRPDISSPLIAKSDTNFDFIVEDMDGQARKDVWDIGADEVSDDPVIRVPVMAADVGIDWEIPPQVYSVVNGSELSVAINNAEDGDVIELTSNANVYSFASINNIKKSILICGKEGLAPLPVISNTQPWLITRGLFAIMDGVTFRLKNVIIDGLSGSSTPADILIQTSIDPMSEGYSFYADNCSFKNAGFNGLGHLFMVNKGSMADTIRFSNCFFSNSINEGLLFSPPGDSQTKPNVSYIEFYNSTFWNFPAQAISIMENSAVPGSTVLKINHCTFDNCGNSVDEGILGNNLSTSIIENSMFTNSLSDSFSINIRGDSTSVSFCNIFQSNVVAQNENVFIGGGMISVDPMYNDPEKGLFNLNSSSPVLNAGNDGEALGDMRWTDPATDIEGGEKNIPQGMILFENYPNPFNPTTTIPFELKSNSNVKISIFNCAGSLIKVLIRNKLYMGKHKVFWDGKDSQNNSVSSGTYFVQITNGKEQKVGKIVLLR